MSCENAVATGRERRAARRVFWDKRSGERPPVGVVNPEVLSAGQVSPRGLDADHSGAGRPDAELAATDYEFVYARPKATCDDGMPFTAAWRAIPWLEAACGICGSTQAAGSLAPARPLHRAIGRLGQRARSRPPAVARPIGVRGAARWSPRRCGLLDQPDDPSRAGGRAGRDAGLKRVLLRPAQRFAGGPPRASRVNQLLLTTLERHFRAFPPKLGGYGHVFGYFGARPDDRHPGRRARFLFAGDVAQGALPAAGRRGDRGGAAPYGLFHLHSTGCRHWRNVLSIPHLAGLQLVVRRTARGWPT